MATHDLEQARRWDTVLCVNRRQVAIGAPERTLDREVLEATYGGAIVEIPGGGGRAILPPHHREPLMFEPFQEPFMQRAIAEMTLLAIAGGALGCWVVLYELSYAAESLAHSIFPGLVLAAIAGVPLLLGATPAIVAGGAGDRPGAAAAGRQPRRRHRRRRHDDVRRSASCWRSRRARRRGSRACCSATSSGPATAT